MSSVVGFSSLMTAREREVTDLVAQTAGAAQVEAGILFLQSGERVECVNDEVVAAPRCDYL